MTDQNGTSKNLYILIFSMLAVMITSGNVIYMALPLYFKSFGLSTTDVGILIALGTLPGAFSSLFMGWLSDHVGRKRLLVISLFLYGSCFLLFYFFVGFASFAITRFIEGFGIWAAVGLAPTIVADMVPPERRGRSMGLYTGITGIGSVIGPLIAGVILTLGSYSYFFIYCATPVFISVLVILFLLKETHAKKAETPQNEVARNIVPVDRTERLETKAKDGASQDKKTMKPLLLFYGAAFVRSVGQTAVSPLMSIFLTQRLVGMSSMELSILFSVPSLLTIVIAPLAGRLSDRIGRKKPFVVSIVLLAVALLLYTQCYDYLQALLIRVLEGTAMGISQPIGNAYVGDLLAEAGQIRRLGAGFGIFQFLTLQTSTFGSIWGGYIADVAGYNNLFAISATIIAASLIPLSRVIDPHSLRKRLALSANHNNAP